MKKAITILAIIAIVAGAVFAAETHQLKVKSDVAEVLPAFNLTFGEQNTNESATNVYGKTPAVDYTVNATVQKAQDVGFDLDEARSFTVTAQVINNVKTNKNFTIEFKGGVFTVNRDTVEGKYSPKQITVADAHTSDAVKTVGNLTASEVNNNKSADTSDTLVASGKVTFSGKTGTGATAALPIMTATYAYLGDDTIDPTAVDQWYYADIKMIVTAGN